MKAVTIFFDLEAWWESQCRRRFDLEETVKKVAKILDENKAKAVFNTCGIVVENFPKMIKRLHDSGHEIASHGYAHENFIQLEQMGRLEDTLEKTEKLIEDVTGERPLGIRPPWLFSDSHVYSTIEKRGYKWISGRSVFRTEVLNNPIQESGFKTIKYVFFGLQWKRYRKEPFRTGNILEIPLLSSQDGELLSLVDPGQETPETWLDFAYEALKAQFDKSGKVFNLNFHPWLIGTSNRTLLLNMVLEYINQKNPKFILAKDLLKFYS